MKVQIDVREDVKCPVGDTEVLDARAAEVRAALCCAAVMKDMPEHDCPLSDMSDCLVANFMLCPHHRKRSPSPVIRGRLIIEHP